MGFMKAEAKQGRLKMAMYGPPGSGKTYTALLFAEGLAVREQKRIAFIDTERGTDFLTKDRPGSSHPKAFDFDAIYTRSIKETLDAVKAFDCEKYGVLVVDSISHIWQAALDAHENKTSIGTIKMQDWGKIKRPFKELIDRLMALDAHVLICGRQKNVFEDDDKGDMRKVGVAMKAEGDTAYEPQICARMEARIDQKNPSAATYCLFAEKDRTSVLAGRMFANPTFAIIEPILALLGNVQAPAEDEEERMAKDGELLDAQDDKSKAKAVRSASLLAKFQGDVAACTTVADLGAMSERLKKEKRYLIEEHLHALRVLYDEKRKRVVEAAAPEGV